VAFTNILRRSSGVSASPGRVRTPTVLQMEAAECGAAALGIILGYYGRTVPLAELRRESGVSRDGSQALHLLAAARRYGMTAGGFSKELDALRDTRPPYIVFWNFNHFLVVEGFRKERVYLNDPATGPRTVSLQEFSEAFTGLVFTLEPGPNFKRGGRKPSMIPSLWERLKGSAGVLMYCVLVGFLLVLPGLALPAFTQVFVDNVLVQGMQDWLRPLILGIILMALLRGLLSGLQLRYLRALKIKLAVAMSSKFLWHALRLPVSFYQQRFAGEISSRMNLNEKVAEILSGRLTTTLIDLVMIVFYALAMLLYDVVLASVGITFAVLNLLALRWISRHRVDANLRVLQEFGKVNGVSIAGLQGIETLKASALESHFFSRWAGYYAKALNAQQELGVTNLKLGTLPTLLSALTSLLVLVVGGERVISGSFTIGMLVAFQSLMQSFILPGSNIVGLGSTIQELQGYINRLEDVLHHSTDPQTNPKDTAWSGGGTKARLEGHVELRNVTFGYNEVAPPLIENLSLSIKPGQRIALVGASGSGKSTVAKLLCGLYEPWKGEVLFDGKPRSMIPRPVLTTSIAMVEQDIFLFEGSVRDNLTLWDSTVPERNLTHACGDAAIYETVISLPGGYDGYLIEGAANLSGGQRQRMEIARALVNNPSILVMDEATSALDAETERVIDQHLRQRGCSCLIVAHRLSTIRDCDEIIVLRQGKVAERGTHEDLWKMQGVYSQLISSEGGALEEA
jgi:ATP-binding cassette subfamily C protein